MEQHPHAALRSNAAAPGDVAERQVASFHQPPGMFDPEPLQKIGETVARFLRENMQEPGQTHARLAGGFLHHDFPRKIQPQQDHRFQDPRVRAQCLLKQRFPADGNIKSGQILFRQAGQNFAPPGQILLLDRRQAFQFFFILRVTDRARKPEGPRGKDADKFLPDENGHRQFHRAGMTADHKRFSQFQRRAGS